MYSPLLPPPCRRTDGVARVPVLETFTLAAVALFLSGHNKSLAMAAKMYCFLFAMYRFCQYSIPSIPDIPPFLLSSLPPLFPLFLLFPNFCYTHI